MSNQRPKDFDSVESRRNKACFLVSGSVDGEVPERVARAWGAEVIRGSANAPLDQLEPHRLAVQESVMSLMRQSGQVLEEVRV